MRKILIRAGMLPTETVDYKILYEKNMLGLNVGNLVYQYAVCRTLMTENTEFIATGFKYDYSEEKIRKLNETCECFVIPLANAFRTSFIPELKALTKLIRKLTIPCYVIGVGIQTDLNQNSFHFRFNDDVKDFVSAVLDKSAIVSLRGQMTADYLEYLGFFPDKHFTVIGCPSMYMYPEISIRDIDITPDSAIAFNMSPTADADMIRYIRENAARFREATYIPQNVNDLKLLYAGIPRYDYCTEGFPAAYPDPVLDDAVFPANVYSWMQLLKTKDFSFGTRLHGNVMAVLSGTPSIHISFETRTEELIQYHHLAHASLKEIQESKSIFDLIEKVDFHAPERVQKQNFDHYLDFLNANQIRHIYLPGEKAAMDEMDMQFVPPLTSISAAAKEEVMTRVADYGRYAEERIDDLRKTKSENSKLKSENSKLKSENSKLKASLDMTFWMRFRRYVKRHLKRTDQAEEK